MCFLCVYPQNVETLIGDGQQQIQMQPYPGKKYQFKPLNKFLSRFGGPSPTATAVSAQSGFQKACTPACLLVLTKGAESDAVIAPIAKKTAGELMKPVRFYPLLAHFRLLLAHLLLT